MEWLRDIILKRGLYLPTLDQLNDPAELSDSHLVCGQAQIAGTICVECLKRIIERSECVMEVAFRRKEKKRATLANQRSRADAKKIRQT